MTDDVQQNLEQQEASRSEEQEAGLSAEAAEANSEWTGHVKEKAAAVKRGGPTGISRQFGKVEINEPAALTLPQAPPSATDAPPKPADAGAGQRDLSSYKGEGIAKNIEPATVYPNHGDTLEKWAKAQVGEDASKDDIAKYVKEIRELNHLKKGDPLAVKLKLPGHTSDGGLVTLDGVTKHTVWADGRDKVEDTVTGKYVLRKSNRHGDYEEYGGSKRP